LLGNFETSGYNEWGVRRDLPGLANVFGFVAGDVQVERQLVLRPNRSAASILKDFEGTKVLPGAEYRLRVKSDAALVLSVVQPYPAFPPRWFTRSLRALLSTLSSCASAVPAAWRGFPETWTAASGVRTMAI